MTDERIPFGVGEREKVLDRYKGRFIYLFTQGGPTFSGRFIGVEDNYAVLNPFQTKVFTKDGNFERKLIGEEELVCLGSVFGIEPTTEESLIGCCKYVDEMESKANGKENPKFS
jgi:hypothetical protein